MEFARIGNTLINNEDVRLIEIVDGSKYALGSTRIKAHALLVTWRTSGISIVASFDEYEDALHAMSGISKNVIHSGAQKSVSVPEFCKVATDEVCSIAMECLNLSDLKQKSDDEEIIQGVRANEIQSALNRAFYAGYRFATKG